MFGNQFLTRIAHFFTSFGGFLHDLCDSAVFILVVLIADCVMSDDCDHIVSEGLQTSHNVIHVFMVVLQRAFYLSL